ncbi:MULTISPECIES: helix-turn-helix transcriptional regulator [unclassified Microbulbifer]|uniref:helix-turn-helix domain-containing protein n=1 Tax=unclassified Microbulbifer TaxID=2619833 RepID=UPI0027E52DEC|nr:MULTISPECIES: helix-turn-helix transcriptional regulator [unclassified Microbulbifer]
MSVIGKRLKEARLRAGLAQERLGILAGIDEMSASARISQYERGVHTPGYPLAERFADVLDVPVEYLYAKNDSIAELLLQLHRLPTEVKREL